MLSICGIDCTRCDFSKDCNGCLETDGKPFGGSCILANCCKKGKDALNDLKKALIKEFNALNIPDMEKVTDLNALWGKYINLEYILPNGQSVKLWKDNKIYLGNQLHKEGSERCYGIAADEEYLMVSEYGCNGSDTKLVILKRWS